MKQEPLSLNLTKTIMVVTIFVCFGTLIGAIGYLAMKPNPKPIKNISSAPKGNQFFYNGNLFIKANVAEAVEVEVDSCDKKQIKNFLAWEKTDKETIYTFSQENQESYDIWKKKGIPPITSDDEAIKVIRDSSKAYFSESESIEEEQEFYFGCKMKAYSKGEYGYAIVGPTVEVIFSGIIYCPENISSLSLKDFTSKLSEVRISKGEEEFVDIFSEKVFHRKFSEQTSKGRIKSEEYIFKHGNYFIAAYYLQQGISKELISDNFNSIVQELVWRLNKGRTFSPDWEYPAGGKVVLADFDSDGHKNEIVIASRNMVYAFDSQNNLLWVYNNIEGDIYNVFADVDLNSDGFLNEIILQTQSQIYAINKTGELLWNYPVANFLGSFSIIPIDLDADGFADDIAFNYWKSVYVLDSNGKLKWKFSGNNKNIDAILAVDLDKDGKMNNLIIGQNGSEAEGMPPTVYAFNEEGMIIWKYELPQDYIFTIIRSDLDCDGHKNEIVVGGNAGAFALNSNGQLLWQNTPRGWTRCLTAIDFNKDGCQNEVIVGGEAGYNNAVDSKGVLIWQSPTRNSLVFNGISPIDLNYDGYSDEVIMGADKIYSLNSQGEEMWVYKEAKNVESSIVADLDGDGFKDEIIAFGDRVYILDSGGHLIYTFGKSDIVVGDLDLDGIISDIIVSFPENTYIYNFTNCEKPEWTKSFSE